MKMRLQSCRRLPAWPWWAGVIVLAFGGIVVAHHFLMQGSLCLFKRLSGWPCLSCGATRCVLAMATGRIATAASYNPLVFALICGGVGWLIVRAIFARQVIVELAKSERIVAWVIGAVVLVANWAYVVAFVG